MSEPNEADRAKAREYVIAKEWEDDADTAERNLIERVAQAFADTRSQVRDAVLEPHKAINLLTALEHQTHRNHSYNPDCAECVLTFGIIAGLRRQLNLDERITYEK